MQASITSIEDFEVLSAEHSDISDLSVSTLSGDEFNEGAYNKLAKANKNKKISWASLGFWDKAALFNKWSVVSLFGDLCTIFGSLFYIMSAFFPLSQTELFIGLGCAFHWISISRYFANTHSYSVITRTLAVAIPMNFKIMLGVMPIFIAFCLFAMSAFWTLTANFNNFSNTSYTLFCMMNGDSILSTFIGTTKTYMIMGQIFCYTFTFLAICVVQNMNLVIVEDSYLNVKYKSNFDWLTGEEGDGEGEEGGDPHGHGGGGGGSGGGGGPGGPGGGGAGGPGETN